jgi:putative nucleotidyltransferase with HDIG domain
MPQDRIIQIEDYVRRITSGEIAHDFKHVDRVRNWALQIAEYEGFDRLDVVQAAALLHDIGLTKADRKVHAEIGAEMAREFLSERNLFPPSEIEEIGNAIRHHNSLNQNGTLADILMDADILDMLGAVGIMRAFTSKHSKPEYDSRNIKGETWGVTNTGFTERFVAGIGIGNYIVDQINFQLSCWDNLRTTTARRMGQPLIEFMQKYLVQLETEIVARQIDGAT